MIYYQFVTWAIPQTFVDTDFCPKKRKFHPDEDYWQHTTALPNHGVYGRGPLNIASASHHSPKSTFIDEDFWQSNLFLNLIWRILLWRE